MTLSSEDSKPSDKYTYPTDMDGDFRLLFLRDENGQLKEYENQRSLYMTYMLTIQTHIANELAIANELKRKEMIAKGLIQEESK